MWANFRIKIIILKYEIRVWYLCHFDLIFLFRQICRWTQRIKISDDNAMTHIILFIWYRSILLCLFVFVYVFCTALQTVLRKKKKPRKKYCRLTADSFTNKKNWKRCTLKSQQQLSHFSLYSLSTQNITRIQHHIQFPENIKWKLYPTNCSVKIVLLRMLYVCFALAQNTNKIARFKEIHTTLRDGSLDVHCSIFIRLYFFLSFLHQFYDDHFRRQLQFASDSTVKSTLECHADHSFVFVFLFFF